MAAAFVTAIRNNRGQRTRIVRTEDPTDVNSVVTLEFKPDVVSNRTPVREIPIEDIDYNDQRTFKYYPPKETGISNLQFILDLSYPQ